MKDTSLQELLKNGVITKKEYDNINDRLDSAKDVSVVTVSIVDIFKRFSMYLKDEYSINTANGYILNTKNFLEDYFKIDNLFSLGREVVFPALNETCVEKWFVKLKMLGYSSTSIKRFKHSLKKFFEYVHEETNIPMPIVDNIDIQKDEEIKEIDVLTDSEIREIADNANILRDKCIILFMYETGMRRQELIDCKLEDIDFESNTVKIYMNGKLDRVGYFTNTTRRLLKQYTKELSEDIEDTNKRRYENFLRTGEYYTQIVRSEYLFQTFRNPQMSYAVIYKALKDASFEYFINTAVKDGYIEQEAKNIADEKVSTISCETLRHSKRAYLFSIGKSVDQVQTLMGDENYWVCKRYLKIAQQIYPKNFE
jgi:site-specific recombinase XerD